MNVDFDGDVYADGVASIDATLGCRLEASMRFAGSGRGDSDEGPVTAVDRGVHVHVAIQVAVHVKVYVDVNESCRTFERRN